MRQNLALIAIFLITRVSALSISTPVTLSLPEGGKPSYTSVAMNEKGEAVVLWTSHYLGETMVEASTRSHAKEWSSPHLIGESHGDYKIHEPKSFVDSDGNVFCVWTGIAEEERFFQWVKKEKNQPWSLSQPVIFENLRIWADFFLNSRGDFLFCGSGKEFTQNVLTYHLQKQEKILQEIPPAENARVRAMAMSPQGKGFVVYSTSKHGYFSSSYILKGICVEKGAKPVTISNYFPEYCYRSVQCTVNDKDHRGVIWSKDNKLQEYFEVTVCVDGKWSEPVNFATGKGIQIPRIAIDPEGNFLVVWSKNTPLEKGLFAAYKPKGQPWLNTVQLFNSNHLRTFTVQIHDTKGHFVVVWDEISGRKAAIHGAKLSTASQSWSSSVQLSSSENSCAHPSMAFNKQGQGIISWEAVIDGRSYIQAADLNLE